jgi:predicted regulator of Ras-like GTPase activity (Roadblock/LC7/MglB family)
MQVTVFPIASWSSTSYIAFNERTGVLFKGLEQSIGLQKAFLCDTRGNARAICATDALPRETYDRIGACVANLFAAFQGHTFREIEIHFEDRLVYARTLGNAFLAIVCARDTNLALLRMACNVAAAPLEADKDLQKNLIVNPKSDIGMRLG